MPELDAIHCAVELVQSRKTGTMDQEHKPGHTPAPTEKTFNIFTGDTNGQLPLAKIQSSVSTLEAPQQQKKSGFFGRNKDKAQARKSAIPEAG